MDVLKAEDAVIQDALAQLEELDLVRESRKRTRGMDYYVPNKMQYEAHRCLTRTILYCGGNRAGKTTFGAMELCWHMTLNYPSWYPLQKRFKRPIKAVVSGTSFAIVSRVIEPKVLSFLPKDFYTIKRTAQGYLSRIIGNNGAVCDILTSEMDDMMYESADWDFAWMDEPQQKRKWQGIQRGLVDRGGMQIITFTPLTEPWMKDDLVDKADGKKITLFQVNIRDNKQTMDGTEILNEERIQEFEDTLPDDVKETRIEGKFFHLKGVVYKEFGEAHMKEFAYEYPLPVIAVLDPHDRVPHHVIWAFIDRDDSIYVDYEYEKHIELDDLARQIVAIEKERGYRVVKRIIDPNFGRKPSKVGTNYTVINELAKHGCPFYEGQDNIDLGHMVVRDYLHYNRRKPLGAMNTPKIFFSKERTPKTIASMRNLQYEEWMGKTAGEKDAKEVEKDKENHGADCVRYLCISRPKFRFLGQTKRETQEPDGPAY